MKNVVRGKAGARHTAMRIVLVRLATVITRGRWIQTTCRIVARQKNIVRRTKKPIARVRVAKKDTF